MSGLFASVAIPRPMRRLFTYLVTPELAPRCRPGVRVMVPFGRRLLTGYLLELQNDSPSGPQGLKPLQAVLDDAPVLDRAMLDLTRWAADYYLVARGEMIRAALPGMQAVLESRVTISGAGRRALEEITRALIDPHRSALASDGAAREILEVLGAHGGDRNEGLRLSDLKRYIGPRFRISALRRLVDEGLVIQAENSLASGPRPGKVEMVRLVSEDKGSPRGARQKAIIAALAAGDPRSVPELLRETGAGRGALRSLAALGRVSLESVEVLRRPPSLEAPRETVEALQPTAGQKSAIDAVAQLLEARTFATCLLHGVTGSGKTEVYLASIDRALAAGRKALYLVPEIALTPLLARRMRARFGDRLALLHSALTEGERYDAWRGIREGRVDVVLGARSAVFAPLPDLGLIIVDEEHDGSYKQADSPRYHGRDLAIVRAQRAEAVVLLGSATPSMESFYQATRGKYRLLTLPDRIGAAGLPRIERVDMRREFEEVGRESILSRRLRAALGERLERREQSLILLNRRGFSTFALCRACGAMIDCRQCSIPMTLHLRDALLKCHYCDAGRPIPAACESCQSAALHFGGTGTERLEDRLRTEFPGARVARMDRDTVRGRGVVDRLLTRFERKEIDILVGTQMIAKGHDFANVTLVGVLAADASLGLPDFRASERTFQLLSQVAGRSGRGARAGEVIIQAYDAEHHAIRAACEHDYAAFSTKELAYRKALRYPPYAALALVLVRDRMLERARAGARVAAEILRGLGTRGLEVLGPAPAPLERLRGEYRVQVLVKTAHRKGMQESLAAMLAEVERRKACAGTLIVDVDPMSTL